MKKLLVSAAVAAFSLAALPLSSQTAHASATSAADDVRNAAAPRLAKNLLGVAHQGAHDGKRGQFSYRLDNNTLPAFEAATVHGFRNETDLRLSSDGALFMIHEDVLEVNSPNCTGLVAETTAAIISTCRTRFGYPLPRLAETLDQVVANGGSMQIELKSDPRIDADPDAVIGQIVAVIRRRGAADVVWLEATKAAYLKSFARVAPEIKTIWKAASKSATGVQARRLDVDSILLFPRAPAAQIADMKANGLEVLARGTRTVAAWNRLEANGFDGGLTNFTPEFEAWKLS
jgi:glycerophosphoryl diester phosphodiesterase